MGSVLAVCRALSGTGTPTLSFGNLPDTSQIHNPILRGAKPVLRTWLEFRPLTYGANSEIKLSRPLPNGRRVNLRAAFGAENLRTLSTAFAGFDIGFQLPRKKLEAIFRTGNHSAKRSSRQGLAIRAVT